MKTIIRSFVLLFILSFVSALNVSAQQTIFNVPSSDILDKGKFYIEFDATFKPNEGDSVGRFSSFVPRIIAGTGGDVEVGLNVTGNIQPGSDSTTLVPAINGGLIRMTRDGRSLSATIYSFRCEINLVTSEITHTRKSANHLRAARG